jgi:hypothetical protein
MPPLQNPRHERFCVLYTDPRKNSQTSGNGTESYIQAGYRVSNRTSAQASSTKLLSNPLIAARIQELINCATEKSKITQEEVITILAQMARFNPKTVVANMHDGGVDFLPLDQWPEEALVACEGLGTRFHAEGVSSPEVKFASKLKAAESLLAHFDRAKEFESGRSAPPAILLNMNADDLKGKGAASVVQAYQALLGGAIGGTSKKK